MRSGVSMPSAGSSSSARSTRVGNLAKMARLMVKLSPQDEPVQRKRRLVAEFCRLLGEQLGHGAAPGHNLPPRLRQTLERILAGDSEKQVAQRLGVSPHTVHVYVKGLYRRYNVSSRGELLARFVRQPFVPPAPVNSEHSPD
jgi:DNA-binding CsgD family transcriptional regulator